MSYRWHDAKEAYLKYFNNEFMSFCINPSIWNNMLQTFPSVDSAMWIECQFSFFLIYLHLFGVNVFVNCWNSLESGYKPSFLFSHVNLIPPVQSHCITPPPRDMRLLLSQKISKQGGGYCLFIVRYGLIQEFFMELGLSPRMMMCHPLWTKLTMYWYMSLWTGCSYHQVVQYMREMCTLAEKFEYPPDLCETFVRQVPINFYFRTWTWIEEILSSFQLLILALVD